jgi:ABC-type transport system substrate-binding protein
MKARSFGLLILLYLATCQQAAPKIPTSSTPTHTFVSQASTEALIPSPTVTVRATLVAASPQPPALQPILSDVRLRQAIAYCTDRAALIRSVYSWLTETLPFEASSFFPPGHWAYAGDDADFTRYPYSPQQGMALLDDAGWEQVSGAAFRINADGAELALTLTTSDSNFRQTWAAVWEEQMKACGIHIVRNHTPAEWFFGEDSGLRRRDFEMTAFAWAAGYDSGGLNAYTRYACDQVPSAANNWQGQNYSGWCNPTADASLKIALGSLKQPEQRAAYRHVQQAYAQDIPGIPLFYRVSLFAVNPALENFAAPDDGIHTWNAGKWRIPGKDTIVIGEDAEPTDLHGFEQSYVSNVIRALVTGVDFVQRNYQYQPVQLKRLPSFDNDGVVAEIVTVKEGDSVVDWSGQVTALRPGVVIVDPQGQFSNYTGSERSMRQLMVNYEFVDGLTWSDGVPVTKADYELAYRAMCHPDIRGMGPFSANMPDPFPACDEISDVDFINDTAYRVTWRPGFSGSRLNFGDRPYFLPPFSRLPAHLILEDGRKLAEAPPGQWLYSDAVSTRPLGTGPYVVKEWVYGQRILLEANPYYFAEPPATPHIAIRFLEHNRVLSALLTGEVDVLDWETIGQDDVEDFQLVQAQAAGKVRLIALPSSTWEQLDFALTLR